MNTAQPSYEPDPPDIAESATVHSEKKLSAWGRFVHWVHVKLEPVPNPKLYFAAIVLALLAMSVPSLYLLYWHKHHFLVQLGWLVLTPVFGTASKLVLGAAAIRKRNWVLIVTTLLMVVTATLLLLALGHFAGIKVAL